MILRDFFRQVTGYSPYEWQLRLAEDGECQDRLIRIPTGFGKTASVTLAWLWNRVHQKNAAWPRRLVLCLPMRTLVEQTERVVSEWLKKAQLDSQVKAHILMGGLSPSDWHLEPDKESVLIGTQDMLLSRALNRGYGSGRARWPMEYALLNVDCLWVMDEIQLMDVGLATSAQIQAFANHDEWDGKLPRPRRTWWMSATLQRDWLMRAPALNNVGELPSIELEPADKKSPLWKARKAVCLKQIPEVTDRDAEQWAELIVEVHQKAGCGVTLAIANTVRSTIALYGALKKSKKCGKLPLDTDLRLVHSRFRGVERRRWASEFLSREQCKSGANRIIVATQVVEAGVDISANVLVTELAPWASLVQRFGRCTRYGGEGTIVIVDRRHTDESAKNIKVDEKIQKKGEEEVKKDREKKRHEEDRETVKPYALEEIEAAAEAIVSLGEAGSAALEQLEKERQDLLPRLFPYAPLHVLTRRELRDLFDTGPDLSGADIDISRFVREGEERDVTVWWWPVPEGQLPHRRLRPVHDALCRVPVGEARKWLITKEEKSDDGESAAKEPGDGAKKTPPRAWVWSYLDGEWERLEERHLYPGQTILVDASAGGYDVQVGFTRKSGKSVPVSPDQARGIDTADAADAADTQDDLSEGLGQAKRQYKTIATHGAEVAVEAQTIARTFGLRELEARALELAGLAHDVGKAHPAFATAIKDRNGISVNTPLAKAPKGRWHHVHDMYNHSHLGKRPGFRHELASALALLELAWRVRPNHPALQGGREELLDLTVRRDIPGDDDRIDIVQGLLTELIGLDETTFNLVIYLVMCHHGKVRATVPMSPHDQDNPDQNGSLPIRGVRDSDKLPGMELVDTKGKNIKLPEAMLRLDVAKAGLSSRYGPSWVERVLDLRERYGDFQIAWFEALLRVTDVRASQKVQPFDPRIPADLVVIESVPEADDRDADLQKWIEQTLAAAQTSSQAVGPRRRKAKASTGAKGQRTSRESASRDTRGGAL